MLIPFLVCVVVLLLVGNILFYLKYRNLSKENVEYVKALKDGQKVVKLVLDYESFYNTSFTEMKEVSDYLEELMSKNMMIADDPDVQKLFTLMSKAYDTVFSYINAKNKEKTGTESEENKEEEVS